MLQACGNLSNIPALLWTLGAKSLQIAKWKKGREAVERFLFHSRLSDIEGQQ